MHCLTTSAPFLNLNLLTDRNYAIGLVLVTIYGMLNFTPMVLLPPLLQQHVGFSDALVGQVIGVPRYRHDDRVHDRGVDEPDRSAHQHGVRIFPANRGRAMDADLRPQRHDGYPGPEQRHPGFRRRYRLGADDDGRVRYARPESRAEASSVFHLLRNIGSSFFISLSIAEIVRTTGANYSRMTEMITPYNQALAHAGLTGAWTFDTCRASPKSPTRSRANQR